MEQTECAGIQTTTIPLPSPVNLRATLECGQVFRWKRCLFPGRPDLREAYKGVVGSVAIVLAKDQEGLRVAFDSSRVSEGEVEGAVAKYLSLRDDVPSFESRLRAMDPVMAKAVAFGSGLRIASQDPWEALASYILSANNSVPNISRIVDNLSARYGEPCGLGLRAFPTVEALASRTQTELRECKCGFRDRYLFDCAKKVSDGEIDLTSVGDMDPPSARDELTRIRGVGPKVADCVLLFGYHMLDVFPVDVWIARAMSVHYMGGRAVTPQEAREEGIRRFGPLAGYAQEHLFYSSRFEALPGRNSPSGTR